MQTAEYITVFVPTGRMIYFSKSIPNVTGFMNVEKILHRSMMEIACHPNLSIPASIEEVKEFAYEKDLQNFLAKNLDQIEPGLKLYEDGEGVNGVEFPVGNRFIDLLAVDIENNYVVIELKVSKGYDKVIGQLLRYIGWIEKHQAEGDQTVRGIIIAKEISEDLQLATLRTPGIRLYEYDLSVSLRKIAA